MESIGENFKINSDWCMQIGSKTITPDVRRVFDMPDVIYDVAWLKNAENIDLYYMYRDLFLSKRDKSILRDNHLRYDITVIPPKTLGCEFVKTAGHYHPLVPETNFTYTELDEVLRGEAHYILQRKQNDDVTDVVVIEAKEGDKVLIPPNYGHITINPSNKELKMSNLVSRDFSSIYDPIKEKCGGSYFEDKDGKFIKNKNYSNLPDIRYLKPSNYSKAASKVGLTKEEEIYGLIRKDPKLLGYLNKPQDFDFSDFI